MCVKKILIAARHWRGAVELVSELNELGGLLAKAIGNGHHSSSPSTESSHSIFGGPQTAPADSS
jgi:hypothetical protein